MWLTFASKFDEVSANNTWGGIEGALRGEGGGGGGGGGGGRQGGGHKGGLGGQCSRFGGKGDSCSATLEMHAKCQKGLSEAGFCKRCCRD